jgi:uncharacterized protein with GYD domain
VFRRSRPQSQVNSSVVEFAKIEASAVQVNQYVGLSLRRSRRVEKSAENVGCFAAARLVTASAKDVYNCEVLNKFLERRLLMTTYIALVNWTDQGVRQVKESPRRLDAARKLLNDMGGDFMTIFLTMGDYDLVITYEAPDDAIAARFILQLGMLGNVRTQTLKAFPESAYREIIASLG